MERHPERHRRNGTLAGAGWRAGIAAAAALAGLAIAVTGRAGAPDADRLITGENPPLATGITGLRAVAVAPDGGIFVAVDEGAGKGSIHRIVDGKPVLVARGLQSPTAVAAFKTDLLVADGTRIARIDAKGAVSAWVTVGALPGGAKSLHDVRADDRGNLIVAGTDGAGAGTIWRVDTKKAAKVVASAGKTPALGKVGRTVFDGSDAVLVIDGAGGKLNRVRLADGAVEPAGEGAGAGGALVFDRNGRLFVTGGPAGGVKGISRPGDTAERLLVGAGGADDIAFDHVGKRLLVVDAAGGKLRSITTQIPGREVDETPLPLAAEPAFPGIQWAGWKPFDENEVATPLRPIVLTHAGDGSGRTFVATQHGVIHVLPKGAAGSATPVRTKVFLDLAPRVTYSDKTNEEGFLGLAFHPNYKENGEFFVFYTVRGAKLTNVLSRFRVSKTDPDAADPKSEQELFRIERPFWNHDGGTITFGPDGKLYVALGDGGAANDPFGHGQNLGTLLGKILRLDVDARGPGKAYGIPADNPFVKTAGARPEIWAYGLRNPWRISFDRGTGKLWAADVGQNLFEEINILHAGANCGWNPREGFHPFGAKGVAQNAGMLEPVWEYHHDVGKSITGGHVYRGRRLPVLEGHYVFADYVTGLFWGLKYDETAKRVTAHRPIPVPQAAVLSFGEDEDGEVYWLVVAKDGQGVLRFKPKP